MSKYLINKIETYRVDSENEAKRFVEDLKKGDGEVLKHSIEYKERKPTKANPEGDHWYRLIVKRQYNDEKEPFSPYLEDEE